MRAMPTQDWFERLMGFRKRDVELTGSYFVARSKPSNPTLMSGPPGGVPGHDTQRQEPGLLM